MSIHYCQIRSLTDDEARQAYNKLTKKDLIERLIQAGKTIDLLNERQPVIKFIPDNSAQKVPMPPVITSFHSIIDPNTGEYVMPTYAGIM